MPTRQCHDPLPALAALAARLREELSPEDAFAAFQAGLGAAFGHRLFTVMLHDAGGGWNRRLYSSLPALWPPGGRKPVADHPWARQLLREGRPWVGRDAAAMRWAYPDHELILSQGLGSAMNLPVRWQGRTLGTLNLLHESGWYREGDAEAGMLFAALAVPLLQGFSA